MLKRVAVGLLLLVLAGQAWAGVCQCLAAEADQHSCCKRESGDRDVISTPPCCDMGCVQSRSNAQQWNSDGQFLLKITLKADIAPSQVSTYSYPTGTSTQSAVPPIHFNNRLMLARPPRLYVRHHSFLI